MPRSSKVPVVRPHVVPDEREQRVAIIGPIVRHSVADPRRCGTVRASTAEAPMPYFDDELFAFPPRVEGQQRPGHSFAAEQGPSLRALGQGARPRVSSRTRARTSISFSRNLVARPEAGRGSMFRLHREVSFKRDDTMTGFIDTCHELTPLIVPRARHSAQPGERRLTSSGARRLARRGRRPRSCSCPSSASTGAS